MLLIPQDKNQILFVGNVNGFISHRPEPYNSPSQGLQLCFWGSDGAFFPLGIYKNQERCMQIMQEIAVCASNGSPVYEMPQE